MKLGSLRTVRQPFHSLMYNILNRKDTRRSRVTMINFSKWPKINLKSFKKSKKGWA